MRWLVALGLSALAACTSASIGEPHGGGDGDAEPDGTGDAVCTFERAPADSVRVRIVYLVPTDKTEDPLITANLEAAAREAQLWIHGQTADGASIYLGDPVVEVVPTPHAAAYYATNAAEACDEEDRFFCNVSDDAFAATGGDYEDPANVWLYYIDADRACGQTDGGVAGVAIVPANDLRGLAGLPRSECDGSPGDPVSRCRWVGGLLFVMMCAMDLARSPGCADADDATPCDDSNILELGLQTYPAASLSAEQAAALASEGFIGPADLPDCALDCLEVVQP